MVRRWALALAFAAAGLLADEGRLLFTTMSDGTIGVTFPSSVLRDDEVRQQLRSGLTTTFAAVATTADRVRTGARIEVRYDLWDDRYRVRRIELDGAAMNVSFSSLDDLDRWWRSTPTRLLHASARRSHVDVELRVLPFSAAESRDAREWLAKGAGVTQQPESPRRDNSQADARLPSAGVIDALIGTSLDAKPLISFRWRAELGASGAR